MAFDYSAKIAALIAHAEDEANPEAARQAYRNKAEELMREYRIAEEEAIAANVEANLPIQHQVRLCKTYTAFTHHLLGVFALIADHCGVRYTHGRDQMITMVGYEGDVRYAEYLYTAAYLMFSTKIDPSWDDSLSKEENIYRLRQAGIKRKDIADKAWGSGHTAAGRSKVQRIYLSQVKARGEDPMASGLSFNSETYRESYAESFVNTLAYRLRQARDAADSVNGGLVLHGRADRVDEAFYEAFPGRRPSNKPAETYVPPNADCGRCTAAASGYCREHRWLKPRAWTKADQARYESRTSSASAQAGRTSGQVAAEGVGIQRGHTGANRLDASGQAIES